MPQKSGPKAPPPTDIRNSQCKVLSGGWRSRAVGFGTSWHGIVLSPMVSRVAPGLVCKLILFVGPAARPVRWPIPGGVARRSCAFAQCSAGHWAAWQFSSLGRPLWGALAGLARGQGGRLGLVGGRSGALRGLGLSSVPRELQLAPRCWLMHNPSLKRSAIGRPPGPGLKCRAHVLRPGPVILPLSSA
jgi:hypothetical protein